MPTATGPPHGPRLGARGTCIPLLDFSRYSADTPNVVCLDLASTTRKPRLINVHVQGHPCPYSKGHIFLSFPCISWINFDFSISHIVTLAFFSRRIDDKRPRFGRISTERLEVSVSSSFVIVLSGFI